MFALVHGLDAQTWTALAAAVSAIAALSAFLVSLAHNRSAARVQLYVEFTRRYNTPEIAGAVEALSEWRRKNGDSFAAVYHKKLMAKEPDAVRLEFHRQALDRYFLDVARAYQAGVLGKKFTRLAADHPGAAVWRQVVVPMNVVRHEDAKADRYVRVLRRVKRRIGDGKIGP